MLKAFWRWLWGIPIGRIAEIPPRGMTTSEFMLGGRQLSSEQEGFRAEVIKARFFSKPGDPVRLCQWCMDFYNEHQPRSWSDLQRLHQKILQASPHIRDDAAICDACYEKVIESVVGIDPYTSQLEPGVSNHGYPNITLRRSLN